MPRFQLIIREPGQEPRPVPLSQAAVVGRSRRADITIGDQEVGREQFRIAIEGTTVWVESLGKTNRTRIDQSVLDAGTRVAMPPGATLYAGRTTFQVRQEGAAIAKTPELDVTMVAPRPAKPSPAPPAPPSEVLMPPEEKTGGLVGPMRTMNMGRPGAPKPPSSFGATGPIVPPGRSAAQPPSPSNPPSQAGGKPQDAGGGESIDQTIHLKGGPMRPGGNAPAKPPSTAAVRPSPAEQPKPSIPPAAPPPAPAPPEPAAPTPTPDASPPQRNVARPSTVALMPDQILVATTPGSALAQQALTIEARLHEALPRLIVKSDALKRKVRLMKACTTIGRAEAADVLLPNESVSESHAEILFDGTTWSLRDCGSTNSSVVDGTQLRGKSQALMRHSLIGLGNLRAIFLFNDRNCAAQDRRLEERAMRILASSGRITRDEGQQAVRLVRDDASQSVAEVLLMETAITPQDWATAVATARQRVTLLDRVRRLFTRKPGHPPAR
ncbi:MAG: FHA domain-containing protein [Planctomycetota bacterium]